MSIDEYLFTKFPGVTEATFITNDGTYNYYRLNDEEWQFGREGNQLTNEYIQGDTLFLTYEQIAQIAHEANRAYCATIGDNSQVAWADAADWQQKSAIEGVIFRLANLDAPASVQHDAWLEAKQKDGWVYGEVKDAEKKTHPCIVAYDELPEEQKYKDALFVAVVTTFAHY